MKKYSLDEIKLAIINHDFCGERTEENTKKRSSIWRSIKNYLIDHENDYEKECEKLKKITKKQPLKNYNNT